MLGLLCFWKSRHVLKKNTTSEEVKVLKFYSKAKASSFRQVVSYTEEWEEELVSLFSTARYEGGPTPLASNSELHSASTQLWRAMSHPLFLPSVSVWIVSDTCQLLYIDDNSWVNSEQDDWEDVYRKVSKSVSSSLLVPMSSSSVSSLVLKGYNVGLLRCNNSLSHLVTLPNHGVLLFANICSRDKFISSVDALIPK